MSWPLVNLDSICEINVGRTPSRDNASYWDDGTHPWVSISDMTRSRNISVTKERFSERARNECGMKVVRAGTVLMSFKLSIGKISFAERDLYTNEAIAALPVLDEDQLNPQYLARALESLNFDGSGKRAVMGTTLNKASLKQIKIPLPPLPEQRRIAAILDQADALRRLRRQSLSRLSDLKGALFDDAFQARNDSDVVPLSEVVDPGTIVTYGIVQAGKEFDGGIPYIRTGDIKGGVILCDDLRHTDPAIAAKFERSRVRAGEIVMSIRATVGTTALVPEMLDGANLTQGTARIAPGPRTHRTYLLEYLRSAPVQQWIQRQVKGATFREITLSRLRELPVQVPPIDVQETFARSIEALENQEKVLDTHLDGTESLFTSVQHRAFRGEL
ncbi:MAG: restriction endonuclease subunit S [Pseudomonadota bacterium]